MPELPEVETVVRGLRKILIGTKVKQLLILWEGHFIHSPQNPKNISRDIFQRKIIDIKRCGKRILFVLSGDRFILTHLKMTGAFLFGNKHKNDKFIRVIILTSKGPLFFSDIRKFGRIQYGNKNEILYSKEFLEIGPDPLIVNFNGFKKRFVNKRGEIKKVLLEQKNISGIGNIYADEILYQVGIHPKSRIENLNVDQFKQIYKVSKKIFNKSIALGGTSIRDFRNIKGEKGDYIKFCRVYGRKGEKCLNNCASKIIREIIGGRSSFYCIICQKKY